MSRRRLQRWATLLSGAALSAACLVPEYRIIGDGSGGGSSDDTGGTASDGTDSGGTQASTGGTQASTGGNASGGSPSTSGGEGGMGGVPDDWSCAEESAHPPMYYGGGVVCGYRYVAAWNDGVIDPDCSGSADDCFTSTKPYATGEVPASYLDPGKPGETIYPGILVGMNLAQPYGGGAGRTWQTSGEGVSVDYESEGAIVPAQIQFRTAADENYCAMAMTGTPLAWSDFRLDCFDATSSATLEEGVEIRSVEVSLRSQGHLDQTITRFQIGGISLLYAIPTLGCDDCVDLVVPLATATEGSTSQFVLDLGVNPNNPAVSNLSGEFARAIFRVQVETDGNAGQLIAFIRDENNVDVKMWTQLAEVTGWYDVVFDVPPLTEPYTFDETAVTAVGLIVGTGDLGTGQTLGDTVVHVESVRFEDVTDGTEGFEFSNEDDIYFVLEGSGIPGSAVEWRTQ